MVDSPDELRYTAGSMRRKRGDEMLSKEQVVLNIIRNYGNVGEQIARELNVKSLSSTIARLRKKGYGITARKIGRSVFYHFTDRQRVQPDSPVYPEAAPKHSRYHHQI